MSTNLPIYLSPRRTYLTKLALRLTSILTATIVIALSATILNRGGVPAAQSFLFALVSPPAFLGLAWSLAEAICIVRRAGHRGIHPGACVALDLIIWLAMLALTVVFGLYIEISEPESLLGDDDRDDYRSGRVTAGLLDTVRQIETQAIAVLVFAAFLIATHFAAFVVACRETNLRNRMSGHTMLVMQPRAGGTDDLGPMVPVPGGKVFYQVEPAGKGLPQRQVYYIAVQPAGQTVQSQTGGGVGMGPVSFRV
ncbi:hypothetical protein QBC47DRAFT_414843 [Echria macrotheca]|uniref:Uncharacterized protein n=1 Tax=Echria macrotheca TaxID=438768 RepID=A0AAJ0BBX2_9PEZI|nr:hypothetical protein QBC47DRAFT_414843 [Echria macrotheca]